MNRGCAVQGIESSRQIGRRPQPDGAFEELAARHSDGREGASGDEDGGLLVWDLVTHARRAALRAHAFMVSSISLTANGRQALSSGWDGKLMLWDLEPNTLRNADHHGEFHSVGALALTPDGRLALAGDSGGDLRLWDLERATPVARVRGHDAEVQALVVTPDGTTAVSSGGDHVLLRWDLSTRTGQVAGRHDAVIHSLAVTPDGRRLVCGSEDGVVRVWDLESWTCMAEVTGHEGPVRAVAAGSRIAISGDDEGVIRYWDVTDWQCLHISKLPAEFDLKSESVFALALSPDQGTLASGGGVSGVVWMWDVQTGKLVHALVGHRPGQLLHCLCFSPDGRLLMSGSADNYLRVWDVETQNTVAMFPAGANVHALVVGKGNFIVCADGLGEVYLLRYRARDR